MIPLEQENKLLDLSVSFDKKKLSFREHKHANMVR